MSRLNSLDASLTGYQESLTQAQQELQQLTKELAFDPSNKSTLAKLRAKQAYVEEIREDINNLTAARQAVVSYEQSDEFQQQLRQSAAALEVMCDHMENKLADAGRVVDAAFAKLLVALVHWSHARTAAQEAWSKHLSKLPIEPDEMENVSFLSRMWIGDASPHCVAAVTGMLYDLADAAGLQLGEGVKFNIYDHRVFGTAGWQGLEDASAVVGLKVHNRALEHHERYAS